MLDESICREGFKEGYAIGYEMAMISQIRKKLAKNYNVAQIAEMLEDTEDNIQLLIEEYDLD